MVDGFEFNWSWLNCCSRGCWYGDWYWDNCGGCVGVDLEADGGLILFADGGLAAGGGNGVHGCSQVNPFLSFLKGLPHKGLSHMPQLMQVGWYFSPRTVVAKDAGFIDLLHLKQSDILFQPFYSLLEVFQLSNLEFG